MSNPTAFPHVSDIIGEGMTLRDYFAGQSLPIFLNKHPADRLTPEDIAKACYRQADAMLAARQEGSTDDQP